MIEEHHLTGFDAPSFFTLHDFNSDGSWTAGEVRRMYGLDDESLKDTPADVKERGEHIPSARILATDSTSYFGSLRDI
jgi:hypothetical protein